ncbi:serine/threonine-protein phosphatase [Planomonospora sp. ID67723]|uniref:PP2C family protein-serine/threonine phosphatase n=1 Tax=Planomonospora sp. ID67723 TaxID=2738134 RepID=UPI001A29BB7A|nr:PP2C family protein-serine/threonine phosphatase [Planomonospora sp. ID67723]MBG0826650.1 serine/threonine-protein phosphatase [Planomonospora sp. ID67723]
MDDEHEQMLGGLIAAHHLAAMEDLPALVTGYASLVGFYQPVLYVADLQHQFLVPLPGQHDADGKALKRLRIDATMAGRAFRNLEIVQARLADDSSEAEPAPILTDQGPRRLWLPMLDGTEHIGVLGLTAPGDDGAVRWQAAQLASLTALLVSSKRSTSDTYARLVRAQPMQLSAEVLWTLLPVRTFATERVVVSAALEPAYVVGGDAFDYALAGDTLHLSIFDAMGHDTAAGLTATIAMGACRNNRRQGADLLATSEAIDAAIAEQFGAVRFATGILASLDTRTGLLSWINRGHHPPLVIRGGHVVATLEAEPDPPMGLGMGAFTSPSRYQLEPGDRLLFYTDGVIEAKNPDGEEFGLERFADFVIRREADGASAPETLRRLIQTLLEHQQDHLDDDATVLLVEWHSQRQHQFLL